MTQSRPGDSLWPAASNSQTVYSLESGLFFVSGPSHLPGCGCHHGCDPDTIHYENLGQFFGEYHPQI